MKVIQILTNVFLSEQEADLLAKNHIDNFPSHLEVFKNNGLERVILAKNMQDDGSHKIFTIGIFTDQASYEKCLPMLKKYASLVEPSQSELPQKVSSSLSQILHDTENMQQLD